MNHVNQSYFIVGKQRLIKLQLHNYSNCFWLRITIIHDENILRLLVTVIDDRNFSGY